MNFSLIGKASHMKSAAVPWEWIQRARAGERSAFDKLFGHYQAYLEFLIQLELGSQLKKRLELEDLLQETLLQAFQSLPQFRGESQEAFRSWLGTVALNVIQAQARRLAAKKRDLDREVSLEEKAKGRGEKSGQLIASLEGGDTSPSQRLLREERFEKLKKALGMLSPDHQEVIRLVRLQGLPMKEAAQRMKRSLKATSVLLWRAMQSLKSVFGDTESFSLPGRNLERELFATPPPDDGEREEGGDARAR